MIITHNKSEFVSSIEQVLSSDNRERIQQGVAKARERTLNRITKKAVDILVEEFA